MPKLAKDIKAVRPGSVYPETIPAGEVVEGRLEEIAKELGALEAPKATKAAKAAPENK